MRALITIITSALLLVHALPLHAEPPVPELKPADEVSLPKANSLLAGQTTVDEGFTSDAPNFFGLAFGDDNDDNHAEFYISLKYPLWRFKTSDDKLRLYVSYSGQYDFYVLDSDVYESSPIVSRVQNPGLFLEWRFRDKRRFDPFTGPKLRFGWMHYSNGQSMDGEVETTDANGNTSIQKDPAVFYDRLQFYNNRAGTTNSPVAYTATIGEVSRGWDYLNLVFENNDLKPYTVGYTKLLFDVRYFLNSQGFTSSPREEDVWWQPGTNVRIEQYDGLRAAGEWSPRSWLLLRSDIKVGYRGLDNWTYKLTANYKPCRSQGLVFSLFYFNGYGKEPSTYQLRNSYFGIGFELRSGLRIDRNSRASNGWNPCAPL